MSSILDAKVALVTGSATGIGRAIVDVFAEAGATGVGMDIVADAAPLPQGWTAVDGDVSDEEEIIAAYTRLRDEFGQLDCIVANAGLVPPWTETERIELDEWDRVFAVNVRGVIATIKYGVPLMKDHGGSIIVMGSLNSCRAHGRQCLYTATKHAVLGIVRATALDLGRYGIRVNAVGPGPVATEALLDRLRFRAWQGEPAAEAVLEQFAAGTALQRMATVGDVARATMFLASDLSSGISGQILPVDAGLV